KAPTCDCPGKGYIAIERLKHFRRKYGKAACARPPGGYDETLDACSIVLHECFAFRSTPAQDPIPVCSRFSETPAGHLFRRGRRRGGELQVTRLRLLAWRHHRPRLWAGAAQLLEFGAGGKFIREIGPHLYAVWFVLSVWV